MNEQTWTPMVPGVVYSPIDIGFVDGRAVVLQEPRERPRHMPRSMRERVFKMPGIPGEKENPMGLLEAINADIASKEREALTTYAQLLNDGSNDAKKIGQLRGAMDTLGKTPEQAGADAGVLRRAGQLRVTIRDGAGLDGARTAAAKALEDFNAETARIKAERADKHRQLVSAAAEVEGRYIAGQQAVNDLASLVARNPQLAPVIEPASALDLA